MNAQHIKLTGNSESSSKKKAHSTKGIMTNLKKSHNINLIEHLKVIEKNQNALKMGRQQETIKLRAEINGIE